MIKIDLITGFLGSGKTTFIRNYANYLIRQGLHIGIIENDFGAINVDMLMLRDLESDQCDLEPIVGGNDPTDWKRRFKAKLILFALQGIDRVLVEPSGIYDVNTFKEILYDESVSSKYEIGNIFTIVNAKLEDQRSEEIETLLVSQIASCGRIVLSKTIDASSEQIQRTTKYLSQLLESHHCDRNLSDCIFIKEWNKMTDSDYESLMNSGWVDASYQSNAVSHNDTFTSLFFMNIGKPKQNIVTYVQQLFNQPNFGTVFRVKGFFPLDDGSWLEVNATKDHLYTKQVKVGQEVVIVIGEHLDKEAIEEYLMGR